MPIGQRAVQLFHQLVRHVLRDHARARRVLEGGLLDLEQAAAHRGQVLRVLRGRPGDEVAELALGARDDALVRRAHPLEGPERHHARAAAGGRARAARRGRRAAGPGSGRCSRSASLPRPMPSRRASGARVSPCTVRVTNAQPKTMDAMRSRCGRSPGRLRARAMERLPFRLPHTSRCCQATRHRDALRERARGSDRPRPCARR